MKVKVVFCFILFQACTTPQEKSIEATEPLLPQYPTVIDSTFENIDYSIEHKFRYDDFTLFYDQFISDSLYQLEHIQFPMKGNYQDYDTVIPWTKKDWPMITFDIRKAAHETDSSFLNQKPDQLFYGVYCKDCGFSFEMEFQKKDNEWYLVYRQENGF